ncbi:MAG: hypothetical protein H0X38_11605 [Planctomycetes bacterium]|nr:hypothetical protein [Planctomycetota bacterium]
MRIAALRLLLLALMAGLLGAADPAAAFKKAMASDDSVAKKDAIGAIGSLPDADVLALLVSAVDDRQAHDAAVAALRGRTGLQPTSRNRSAGYPGYPTADTGAAWGQWLAARTKEKDAEKKSAEQDKKLKELEEAKKKKEQEGKDGKDGKDGKGEKPADGTTADAAPEKKSSLAVEPPADLGRPDRILFKNGGSLVCYILSKRTDADGVLQSVRIVHLDDGGEEILSADLISRIEEDIR